MINNIKIKKLKKRNKLKLKKAATKFPVNKC